MSSGANLDYKQTEGSNFVGSKRLGGYLVEAGLITPAQIEVALNDQRATGMRFGDILVARGWVKEQTVEYLMRKIVVPERQAAAKNMTQPGVNPRAATGSREGRGQRDEDQSWQSPAKQSPAKPATPMRTERKLAWGELPVSKPLPTAEDDVQWAG